jgi:mannose-6-phosphate isomerase-like protein (cupin superfamily)
VLERDAREVRDSLFGAVGVLHDAPDLKAWWIWKDREEIDPSWKVFDREDFLYVVQGALKLELRGHPEGGVVLQAGDSFVIPPGVAFRGYRWPRDGEPCLFVAVSPADVGETTAP